MQPFKTFQSSFEKVPSCITRAMMVIFLFISVQLYMSAQATLSVQGILKKANGVALEDGVYSITFKIYFADETPPAAQWMETIDEVEVTSGIYSVILGENPSAPLNLPFNDDYALGVSIGSQEMRPRIKLTSAPYALALRGSTNQFPSSGLVLADEIRVADGVLASGGAPGSNNVNKNGYSFHNGGDNDGGLFSTQEGEVSIYTNGTERLEANSLGVRLFGTLNVQGTTETNQLNLFNDGGINYSTLTGGSFPGWRLVDVDDFSGGVQGWASYGPVSGQWLGWNQTMANGTLTNPDYGAFAGRVITPGQPTEMLKKQFSISGTFSQIKVKFRYYFLDSWDWGIGDVALAGFATEVNGSTFRVGWHTITAYLNSNGRLNTDQIRPVLNLQGVADRSDTWTDVEMTAQANGNSFWLFIGAALDGGGTGDESYAIGHLEIWVR